MKNGYFCFSDGLTVTANRLIINDGIRTMTDAFLLSSCKINTVETDGFFVKTENMSVPEIGEGKEYRIVVSESGFAVFAENYQSLARAVLVLLAKCEIISYENEKYIFGIKTTDISDSYTVKKRMIHFCVFPETPLSVLRREIRLAAIAQYTHICIEFWGMLRYDFCDGLSWGNAFSKEQIKPIIDEMRQLGVEPIPMFNMLGHASGSRACYGKHVMLDRNPKYQYLFTPDGWAWNINSEKTRLFLRNVRAELYELFGNGEYFHVGCDENYQNYPEFFDNVPQYLSDLCREVLSEGRKPILWGDSFLNNDFCKTGSGYCCLAKSSEAAKAFLNAIPKEAVIADWQYDMDDKTAASSEYLMKNGYSVLGCPWFTRKQVLTFLATEGLYGMMITTWHTLPDNLDTVLTFAHDMGAYTPYWYGQSVNWTETAALWRKTGTGLSLSYDDYGWHSKQVTI